MPLVLVCGARDADLSALYEAGVSSVFVASSGPLGLDVALTRTHEELVLMGEALGGVCESLLRGPQKKP